VSRIRWGNPVQSDEAGSGFGLRNELYRGMNFDMSQDWEHEWSMLVTPRKN